MPKRLSLTPEEKVNRIDAQTRERLKTYLTKKYDKGYTQVSALINQEALQELKHLKDYYKQTSSIVINDAIIFYSKYTQRNSVYINDNSVNQSIIPKELHPNKQLELPIVNDIKPIQSNPIISGVNTSDDNSLNSELDTATPEADKADNKPIQNDKSKNGVSSSPVIDTEQETDTKQLETVELSTSEAVEQHELDSTIELDTQTISAGAITLEVETSASPIVDKLELSTPEADTQPIVNTPVNTGNDFIIPDRSVKKTRLTGDKLIQFHNVVKSELLAGLTPEQIAVKYGYDKKRIQQIIKQLEVNHE